MKRPEFQKILLCTLCGELYSRDEARRLDYFPDTGVCFFCYTDLQKKSQEESCFGKPTRVASPGPGQRKVVFAGYEEDSLECRRDGGLCPDRLYCPLFITGEIQQMRAELTPLSPLLSRALREGVIA